MQDQKLQNNFFKAVEEDLENLNDKFLNEISPASRSLKTILENIFQQSGKRLRPTLSFLFAKLIQTNNINQKKLALVAETAELIHTASLVHDDIIDNSLVRRGQPTTNSQWDTAITVISGDFLFSRAAVNLSLIGINEITGIFARVLENLCDGEIWQAERKYNTDIDYEYYLNKTFKKTASLFEAACKASAIVAQGSEEQIHTAANFGRNFGMTFQIIDDILDFTQNETELGKPSMADVKEGTITLPLLIALEKLEKSEPELCTHTRSLIKSDITQEELQEIKKTLEETNAIQEAFNYSNKFINDAKESLEAFSNTEIKNCLLELLEYSLVRKF